MAKITIENEREYVDVTVRNGCGMTIVLCSLGAAIRSIRVPDRDGREKCVTIGPVKEELFRTAYHGKTIGRTAGRIAGATFSIDGKRADLEKNNFGRDNLHGGGQGFHAKNFGYEIGGGDGFTDVIFRYFSPDGEGGYFGNVEVTVTYRIREQENAFSIVYGGKSDVKTLLNLTNHVYLNMSGDAERTVKEQILYINARTFGRLNDRLVVEEILPVNEEMDFSSPHLIGDFIEREGVQRDTKGYDHPYFLSPHAFDEAVCSLYSPFSGIKAEIRTTYPCVVFYADGQADGSVEVFPGKFDEKYLAACLECQYHPDGVHQDPARCGIVAPERPYREEICYRFLTVK